MNAPAEGAPPPSTGQKMGFASATATAITLLMALLLGSEKRVYTPYLDVFGVPTVCEGITGPEVVWGHTYTDAECDTLVRNYIQRMLAKLGQCVSRQDLDLHQVIAWTHFAYNTGWGAFCKSQAAKLLNARQDSAACDQIMRWTKGTDRRTGQRVDCAIRANKCWGLYDRRVREKRMCGGDLTAFRP